MIVSQKLRFLTLLATGAIYALCLVGAVRVWQRPGLPATLGSDSGGIPIVADAHRNTELRAGDRILGIRGHRVHAVKSAEFVIDGMTIGDTMRVELERGGKVVTANAVLVPYYGASYLLLQSLAGSLFAVLGLVVLLKNPRDEASFVFHWLATAGSAVILTTWGRYALGPPALSYAVHSVFSAATAFLPVLCIHLSLLFPTKKFQRSRRVLLPLYIFSAMLAGWLALVFSNSIYPLSLDWLGRYMQGYNLARVYLSIGLLVVAAVWVHSYRRQAEEAERRKIRLALSGMIIGLAGFPLLWVLPDVVAGRPAVPEELILLLMLFIPVSLTISLVKYRLFQIDHFLRRGTVYVLAGSMLLAAYFALMALVGKAIGLSMTGLQLLATGIAAVAAALLFEPMRTLLHHLVDRYLFRVRYTVNVEQQAFADAARNANGVPELAALALDSVDSHVYPEAAAVFMRPPGRSTLVRQCGNPPEAFHSADTSECLAEIPPGAEPTAALSDAVETDAPCSLMAKPGGTRAGAVVISSLRAADGTSNGCILLAGGKSGALYSVEDVMLLNKIADHTGIALERIRLQSELARNAEKASRLAELNQLKSFFVSSVSHELKTPLTGIKLFAENLEHEIGDANAQASQYLRIIEGETERLARRIDNVLNFAKSEKGTRLYRFVPTDLNALVQEVVDLMQYVTQMHECGVEVRLHRDLPPLQLDPDAVREALTNLIGNALKFSTAKKQIHISTTICGDYVQVCVRDHGIGISEQDLPHLFKPFYRAARIRDRKIGGAGIGLALVKHTMDAHQGKIDVTSAPDEGSTFTLTFKADIENGVPG